MDLLSCLVQKIAALLALSSNFLCFDIENHQSFVSFQELMREIKVENLEMFSDTES